MSGFTQQILAPRRCPCPGSVPWSAAGWPAAGGTAYSAVRLALAKSRWLFAALQFCFLKKKTPETVCGSLGACLPVNVCAEFSSNL